MIVKHTCQPLKVKNQVMSDLHWTKKKQVIAHDLNCTNQNSDFLNLSDIQSEHQIYFCNLNDIQSEHQIYFCILEDVQSEHQIYFCILEDVQSLHQIDHGGL